MFDSSYYNKKHGKVGFKLQCHKCECWYHKTCINIESNVFENLKSGIGTWFCTFCTDENGPSHVSTMIPKKLSLNESLNAIMSKLNGIEDKYAKLLAEFEDQLRINGNVR